MPTPYRADYVFVNWYYDNDFTQLANGSDEITKSTVLYAFYLKTDKMEPAEADTTKEKPAEKAEQIPTKQLLGELIKDKNV